MLLFSINPKVTLPGINHKGVKMEFTSLENMIDRIGLAGVLSEIERICYKKSEHLRSISPDDGYPQMTEAADGWYRRGIDIGKAWEAVHKDDLD